MKKWLLILTGVLFFIDIDVLAQGVKFEKITYQEALSKARKENRLVFIDCYTEWCGPCKGMDKQVFPKENVGTFMNAHFVNLKMDMEKGEGPVLLKKYAVGAFPTFLLLKPDGSLHFKFVGGMSDSQFVSTVRAGMAPDNKVFALQQAYASGDRSPEVCRNYIKMKVEVQEIPAAQEAAKEYLASLSPKDRTSPENWFLFGENRYAMYLSNVHSASFRYLVQNRKAFIRKIPVDTVDARIRALYGALAEHALRDWYFKKEPYMPGMFDDLVAYAEASGMKDKKQLVELIRIADAAGRKDDEELLELLAANATKFSEQHKRVFFPFVGGYLHHLPKHEFDGILKRMFNDLVNTSANPHLVSLAGAQLKRLNENSN
ncbi:MAG: thioredoxin family protein [Chitinophagaceae bacterium]